MNKDLKTILYIGPSGVGKTFKAVKKAKEKVDFDNLSDDDKKKRYKLISLHQGYCYEDFIMGINVSTDANSKINFQSVSKVFKKICDDANKDKLNKYAIVLDDIHRVNLSAVLGEVLSAIENRGESITLANGSKLIVPNNLYIYATMSTIKSQFKPDYALLRRFNIVPMKTSESMLMNCLNNMFFKTKKTLSKKRYKTSRIHIKAKMPKKIRKINQVQKFIVDKYNKYNGFIRQNISPDFKPFLSDYLIGHGFFIPKNTQKPKACVLHQIRHQVIPLLEQYVKDGILTCSIEDIKLLKNDCNTEYTTDYSEVDDDIIEIMDDNELNSNTYNYLKSCIDTLISSNFSPKISRYQLLNQLFTNTNIICFKNKYKEERALFCKKTDIDNFLMSNNTSKFYSDKGGTYKINGIEYKITNAFTKSLLNSINTRNYKNTNYVNNSTNIVPVLYRIVEKYYEIYLLNINNFLKENPSNKNMQGLKNIVQKEYDSIKIIENQQKGWLGKNFDDIKSEIDKLKILNAKPGDKIKDANGNDIEVKGVYKIMSKDYKTIMDNLGIHQMILQGPPGTSKTYGAKEFLKKRIDEKDSTKPNLDACKIDYSNLNIKEVNWDLVQFHPSYGYEDFVRGIEVSTENKVVCYNTVNKILGKIAQLAEQNTDKEFYLIIDEINRANMATVFGELIYALEYRGQAVSTPYTVSKNNNIVIPDNLYIIGTMNTADKSIGGLDYAIRRRFLFFPTLPDREVVKQKANNDNNAIEVKLFDAVAGIFDTYLNYDYYKDDVQIGHTYFLRDDASKAVEQMKERFIYQVMPILREYWKDGILETKDSTNTIDTNNAISIEEASQLIMNAVYNQETDLEKLFDNLNNKLSAKNNDDDSKNDEAKSDSNKQLVTQ